MCNADPMALIQAQHLLALLRLLGPERAHGIALAALRSGLVRYRSPPADPILSIRAIGLEFANPLGLAAGFDKNAVAVKPMARLGFGFIEAGTVTLRGQVGNPAPRLFRLSEDRAILNRMGFNNAGIDPFVQRLRSLQAVGVPVGANVGLNKNGAEPERDYPRLIAAVAPFVDYVAINVSSPNTPGLRALQGQPQLRAILRSISAEVAARPPLLVKIAPDLSGDELAGVVDVCIEQGAQGLIISNTTVERPATLRSKYAAEAGGLSGRPLFARSTAMLARAYLLARDRLVLVGVGGVSTGREALIKVKAGATLIQLYTALIFEGPTVVTRIQDNLAAALRQEGYKTIRDAIGTEASRLAEGT